MLFEFRVRHSEFTFLYHPSAASGVRCASSTFNIAYSANHSSCRSCLRRYCTSTSLQSLSQSEVSCHSVSALSSIRKLPPGSVVPSRIVAELSHTLFDIIQIFTQCRIQQFSTVPACSLRQGRTTAPNFNRPLAMQPYVNNVELHLQSKSSQRCRTKTRRIE